MSTDPAMKTMDKMTFWITVGSVVFTMLSGMFSFSVSMSNQEIRINQLEKEALEAKAQRQELDAAKNNIMLKLNTLETEAKHSNTLLREIKTIVEKDK